MVRLVDLIIDTSLDQLAQHERQQMFTKIETPVSDELFAQLRRCPIDDGELDRVLKGLDLANVGEVSAVIGASELTLRDLEELADALLKYGLPSNRIIEILTNLNEQEIESRKVFG